MPMINAINKLEEKKYERMDNPREDYARIQIDLGNVVGTDIEFSLSGSYMAKIGFTGSDHSVYFKIDKRHAAKIYANEFQSLRRNFDRLYITNATSQTGKYLILEIGQNQVAEVEPDTLDRVSFMEDSGHITGSHRGIMPLGVRLDTPTVMTSAEGDYSPLTVDKYGRLVVTRETQLTDSLIVTGDGLTDTIAAPAAGYALEVYGYQITEHHAATLAMASSAKLKFETSGKQIWVGASGDIDALENVDYHISGICVRGNAEEALTLTNVDWTAVAATVQAIVFYRVVEV